MGREESKYMSFITLDIMTLINDPVYHEILYLI